MFVLLLFVLLAALLAAAARYLRRGPVAPPPLILLEGSIAAGKTTLIRRLQAAYPSVSIIAEPVAEWTNFHGVNMLERMYNDRPRWTTSFQMLALLTLSRAAARHTGKTRLMERSWLAVVKVFGPVLQADGFLDPTTATILEEWAELVASFVGRPAAILYLRTSPHTCHQRLQHRARAEEAGVSLPYLEQLGAAHDAWLLRGDPDVYVIDGEGDPDHTFRQAVAILSRIPGFH